MLDQDGIEQPKSGHCHGANASFEWDHAKQRAQGKEEVANQQRQQPDCQLDHRSPIGLSASSSVDPLVPPVPVPPAPRTSVPIPTQFKPFSREWRSQEAVDFSFMSNPQSHRTTLPPDDSLDGLLGVRQFGHIVMKHSIQRSL